MSTPFFAVLPNTSADAILLFAEGDQWSLPRFTADTDFWFSAAAPVNRAVLQALGVRVTVQRCLAPPGPEAPGVFALHNHSPGWLPPQNAAWISSPELQELPFAVPDRRRIAEEWFAEGERQAASEPHPPWTAPTWYEEVTGWIAAQVGREGARIVGAPEQVKTWSISCVLRVPTTAGTLYFKAVPPLFAQEPRLTQRLAALYPRHLPDVVAIDADQRWLLMREFSGPTLREGRDVAEWEAALRAFARMQVECTPHTDALLSWGCAERRLGALAAQVGPLLEEVTADDARRLYGLTEAEGLALRGQADALRTLCVDLAAYGVPETLVHGDLHGGNILARDAATGRRILLFDWTDGAVGQPFFDLLTLLEETWVREDGAALARLRDAYLEAWTGLMPLERLRDAFALSQRVAPLYHAVSYRNIALSTAPTSRWELAGGAGDFLKRLLPRPSQTP